MDIDKQLREIKRGAVGIISEEELEKKLNGYISEIDRCIAILSR